MKKTTKLLKKIFKNYEKLTKIYEKKPSEFTEFDTDLIYSLRKDLDLFEDCVNPKEEKDNGR